MAAQAERLALGLALREQPLRRFERLADGALAGLQLGRLLGDALDLTAAPARELLEVARPDDHLVDRSGRENERERVAAAVHVRVAGAVPVRLACEADLAAEALDGRLKRPRLGPDRVDLGPVADEELLAEGDLGAERVERLDGRRLLAADALDLLLDALDLALEAAQAALRLGAALGDGGHRGHDQQGNGKGGGAGAERSRNHEHQSPGRHKVERASAARNGRGLVSEPAPCTRRATRASGRERRGSPAA